MKVVINNTTYDMSRATYEKILDTSSKFVPYGVYAVEKDDFAEMKTDKCKSAAELKKRVSDYTAKGFKVYYNK